MLCSKSHQAVTINPPLTELQEEDDKAQPRPVSNDTFTLQPLPLEAEDVPILAVDHGSVTQGEQGEPRRGWVG